MGPSHILVLPAPSCPAPSRIGGVGCLGAAPPPCTPSERRGRVLCCGPCAAAAGCSRRAAEDGRPPKHLRCAGIPKPLCLSGGACLLGVARPPRGSLRVPAASRAILPSSRYRTAVRTRLPLGNTSPPRAPVPSPVLAAQSIADRGRYAEAQGPGYLP